MARNSKEEKVWVCGACGKIASDPYEFNDVSCMLNSVLCYAKSLKFEKGRVVAAIPAKEDDETTQ